jgi:hypothetical protein
MFVLESNIHLSIVKWRVLLYLYFIQWRSKRSENISLNSTNVNDDFGKIWNERFLALLEMSRKFPGRIEERTKILSG